MACDGWRQTASLEVSTLTYEFLYSTDGSTWVLLAAITRVVHHPPRAQISARQSSPASSVGVLLPAGSVAVRAIVSNSLRIGSTINVGTVAVSAPSSGGASPECAVLEAVRTALAASENARLFAAVRSLVGALGASLNDAAAADAGELLQGCSTAAGELVSGGAALVDGTDTRKALRLALRERLLAALDGATSGNSFVGSADGAASVVHCSGGA